MRYKKPLDLKLTRILSTFGFSLSPNTISNNLQREEKIASPFYSLLPFNLKYFGSCGAELSITRILSADS